MAYDKFYRFYDLIMGDRSDAARYIAGLIEHHKPDAKTVLEIACGTGTILGALSASYEITGLDRSRSMLALARKKLPHVRFFRQEMTSFQIAQRFDAVVCVFDSINHLLRFAEWEKTFRRVAQHVKHGGLFIFDVNTLGKLQRLAESPSWEKWFDRDLAIIKVTGGEQGKFAWDVKIFEHQNQNSYKLIHENIPEIAFPMRRILSSLREPFEEVKVFDPFGAKATDQSERLYFVCKARGT
jgi:SAM-dependent methyltransferase